MSRKNSIHSRNLYFLVQDLYLRRETTVFGSENVMGLVEFLEVQLT